MSEQTHAEWLRENAAFFEQCNENLDVGSLSPEDIARMRLVATEMDRLRMVEAAAKEVVEVNGRFASSGELHRAIWILESALK